MMFYCLFYKYLNKIIANYKYQVIKKHEVESDSTLTPLFKQLHMIDDNIEFFRELYINIF